MKPNFCISAFHASPAKFARSERSGVKRFSLIIAGLACVTALAVPQRAEAAPFKWVRRVLEYKNPYRGKDVTRYPGFRCIAYGWNNHCTAYTYDHAIRPDDHPGGGKPKRLYRNVTSPGFSPLNYSGCQLDNYHQDTARRTYPTICDYGEPRAYSTAGGTR